MARLKRVNYSTGQLLNAEDLRAEQEYHREKHRRHNLLFHGSGIVVGLKVSTATDSRETIVTVAPGHAVDAVGNDIELCEAVNLRLPKSAAALVVELRYAESLTDPVPVLSEGEGEQAQPSRIEEGGEVVLVTQTDSASSKALRTNLRPNPNVVLARLIQTRRGWQVDRRHKVPRTR